jgi:hypothetical protein
VSRSDEKKMAALVRKLAATTAKKKTDRRRQYDPTLRNEVEEDTERRNFFSEMQKREF